jgi:hypothetical protein
MSDYRWTMTDGIDINAMEFDMTMHIDDAMKYILESARFGEISSMVVNYSNDQVRIYKCYQKED